jgi:hypothetical protein
MAKLYNLARMTTATTGTGTIALGAAVSGYLTFALAGVANGDVVTYAIKDGANSEIGEGVYTASGTTLTRSVLKSTNANAAVNLSGAAEVFITPSSKHFFDQGTACLFQQTSAPTGWTKSVAHNDKALRVVNGAASVGGVQAFSTVFGRTSTDNTSPSTTTMASHSHTTSPTWVGTFGGQSGLVDTGSAGSSGQLSVGATGSSVAHAHTMDIRVLYVDIIIATKD